MNSLTFGRYSQFNTFIHKVDPRNKVLLLILLMVSIFLRVDSWSSTLIISGILFLVMMLFMILSKTSILSLLKMVLSMWFVILLILIMYIVIPNSAYVDTPVAFKIGSFAIYVAAFYQAGYIILRLLMMLMVTMILTSTTKPMDLTYAFEWYMTPLKVIKFPAHELAMVISIALRFIPTLLDETNRIIKAQESRGVDFTRGGLFKKFQAMTSLIIPLLISSFSRSEQLADAMEARGYNPREKRTRYHKLTFSYRDIIAFLVVGVIFGGILALAIIDKNVAKVDLINWIFHVEAGW